MKQRGFHRNKTSIAHFSRSLSADLVANSDQLFLPINIFPLQDLVLGVFSQQFTPPNASEARRCKKRNQLRHLFFCRLKSVLNCAGLGLMPE
jgi:hypothetical protein